MSPDRGRREVSSSHCVGPAHKTVHLTVAMSGKLSADSDLLSQYLWQAGVFREDHIPAADMPS